MNTDEIIYQVGFSDRLKSDAVTLYDEAFGKKISIAIKSLKKRQLLLSDCLMPKYSIVALWKDEIVGIAGFNIPDGSLTGGITYEKLVSHLGFIKGSWAALIFSFFDRKSSSTKLVMDGLSIRQDAQGRGIGSRLLDEIKNYAIINKFKSVRLDVIDINPKAKKLYERKNFKSVEIEYFPYLRWFLGFGGNTIMELDLNMQGELN